MRHNVYPPMYRRKHTGAWVLFFLIAVVLVVIYASSKGLINLGSINLGLSAGNSSGTNSSPQNTAMQACTQAVNGCVNIINQKYGSSVSILKQAQSPSANDANSFLRTWGGTGQSTQISSYGISSFPVIMTAVRIDMPNGGTKTPHVFICDSQNNLVQATTSGLC